jgi:hypothetical protein
LTEISYEDWLNSAREKFGKDPKRWKFQCVSCGGVQSIQDFNDHGIEDPASLVYFSCIGRWVKGRGCDWTLGGLLHIHEREVVLSDGTKISVFLFAGETKDESVC